MDELGQSLWRKIWKVISRGFWLAFESGIIVMGLSLVVFDIAIDKIIYKIIYKLNQRRERKSQKKRPRKSPRT